MKKEIEQNFESYPVPIRKKLEKIRSLSLEVASDLGGVEETLKWGEPSYHSDTIRLNICRY